MSTRSDYYFADMLETCLGGERVQSRNSAVLRATLLSQTFYTTPLITLRQTAWKSAIAEMEWFLSGSNLVADLPESVQKWWTPWANEHGCVANNYSSQFRAFAGAPNGDHVAYCDQIEYLIESLKSHPNSRRAVITSWNTADMASSHTPITNCHGTVIQCFVDSRDNVDMFMYQRSADMVVGTPHNWIQYWALLQYLAHRAGRQPGKFTWMGGDCHIYEDHVDLVKRMLEVCNEDDDALGPTASPQLIYTPSSDEFLASDFSLDAPYAPAITESAKMVV